MAVCYIRMMSCTNYRKEKNMMFDPVTMKLNADPLILSALQEDITSGDVSAESYLSQG